MRYMICYRGKEKVMPEPVFCATFQEAVFRYTELCSVRTSDWRDVVLADLQEEKIIRHFACRDDAEGISVTNF